MARRPFLLALALLALAGSRCTGTVLELDSGDASAQDVGGADGGESTKDAQPSFDAGPQPGPDASTSPEADAAPTGLDAAPAGADAAPAGPDAAGILPDAGPSSARQTAHPLGSTSAANGFYEYLPPGYEDGAVRPLLVFWHGVGEDGNGTTDLAKVLVNGPPMLIANNQWPGDRPFIVLSPQHGPSNCPSSDEIHNFITWALANYHVDLKRTYLTGLSCGAIGSWDYLGNWKAQQVAAAVLIAGDPGDPAQSGSAWGRAGCSLGELALWAFHGDSDPVVNWANEKATLADLLACPEPPRRDVVWTVIVGGSHNVWAPIYDLSAGYDVYSWLLANPKP
jgi:predicted esterase